MLILMPHSGSSCRLDVDGARVAVPNGRGSWCLGPLPLGAAIRTREGMSENLTGWL
jgi:hypothetical protein